jgi:predicted PP-loop superfamily ATPase
MMKFESISTLIQDIRHELGLKRGAVPIIKQVFTHSDGSLHIVTSDRSEKNLLLGPRGRVSAELSKRLSFPVTIYGDDELLLRRHRLELALKRIEELNSSSITIEQQQMLSALQTLIIQELNFPKEDSIPNQSIGKNARIAVAFSGGVDSSAALVILKQSGFEPEAITVNLGYIFFNPREMNSMSEWCSHLSIKHIQISPKAKLSDIIQRTRDGRVHPCGECHTLILDSVRDYAVQNGHSVLITGELLPTGRQSIEVSKHLLIIHLPGALMLTKHRTGTIAKMNDRVVNQRTFGCSLLAESHLKGWKNMGPSIFRVLRELEAGILTSGQALQYIKSIVKSENRGSTIER